MSSWPEAVPVIRKISAKEDICSIYAKSDILRISFKKDIL